MYAAILALIGTIFGGVVKLVGDKNNAKMAELQYKAAIMQQNANEELAQFQIVSQLERNRLIQQALIIFALLVIFIMIVKYKQ